MQKPRSCRHHLHTDTAAILRVKITSSSRQQRHDKGSHKSDCGESCSPFDYLHSLDRTHRTPPSVRPPENETFRNKDGCPRESEPPVLAFRIAPMDFSFFLGRISQHPSRGMMPCGGTDELRLDRQADASDEDTAAGRINDALGGHCRVRLAGDALKDKQKRPLLSGRKKRPASERSNSQTTQSLVDCISRARSLVRTASTFPASFCLDKPPSWCARIPLQSSSEQWNRCTRFRANYGAIYFKCGFLLRLPNRSELL